MADRKISDLTALTTPASGDFLPIVDISEAAAASKNKRITIEELFRGVPLGTAAAPSIAIEGNENTGVYSPGANQLAVATNGAGRLFIDASGNVGVGVATPTASSACINIELPYGSTLSARSDTAAPQFAMMSNAVGNWYAPTYKINGYATQYLQQGNDGTHTWHRAASGTAGNAITFLQSMTLDASGRLGIGTSAPADILHIGGSSNQQIRVNGSGAPIYIGSANSILNLAVNRRTSDGAIPDATKSAAYINLDGSGSSSEISFLTASAINTQPTVKAVIDGSGRVGIGTTTVNRKLEVSDAGADNFIRVNTTGATKSGIEFASSGLAYSQLYFTNVSPYDLSLLQQYTTGSLILGTNSTEKARIDSSGRLLVGASADSGGALLQVNGDRIRVATAKTPASAADTGTAGEICWDADYIYVCTATNTWKRSAIATW